VTTIYVTHDQVEAITLGGRIAVLLEGVLQQIGPPQDVYDHPDNVFVAGFIGSPPMNLLKGRATGGRITVGDLRLDVAHVPDGDVLVGIRPEGLRLVGPEQPGFDVHVEVVEPLGDEVLVHGSIEAREGAVRFDAEETMLLADKHDDRANVTVRLPPEARPKAGSRLRVAVKPDAIRLFDVSSGRAIRVP
jgi:ABC-type sugar transport system ATPase subunit